MDLRIRSKPDEELLDTPLVPQTHYWSRVKRAQGWSSLSLDLEVDGLPSGDVLLLHRGLGGGENIAYVPYGPEFLPDEEGRGAYLAALSQELRAFLPSSCLMVRWDLPWESPYAREEERYDEEGHWLGPPSDSARELRMNWGLEGPALRKAPTDLLPPDTWLVDLRGDDETLLGRMRPKTRYNLGLAARRGVGVREGGPEDLPLWNALYEETAARNRLNAGGAGHFAQLFAAASGAAVGTRLLVAEAEGEALAALFLARSADRGTYLYGASTARRRELMAPYALQWRAMRLAREAGCASYDLFGSAPRPDPEHPMYGLYQFKRGFGGRLFHRQGAWDFPFDEKGYRAYVAAEAAAPAYSS